MHAHLSFDGRCLSFDSSPLSPRATSPGRKFSAVIWSAGGEPRITILHYINICITINISQVTGGLAPALTCLDTVRERIGTQPLIKLKQSAWDVAVSKLYILFSGTALTSHAQDYSDIVVHMISCISPQYLSITESDYTLDCGGITYEPYSSKYTLRRGTTLRTSPSGEISWKRI